MADVVVALEAFVDRVDVVDEGDVEVGVKGAQLVEVVRVKQPVLPAEGGVGVDDDVLGFVREGEQVFEDAAAEGVEARLGQVEDAAGDDVGRFLVHAFADVEGGDLLAMLAGDGDDALDEFLFVQTELAGKDHADAAVAALPPKEAVAVGCVGRCHSGRILTGIADIEQAEPGRCQAAEGE